MIDINLIPPEFRKKKKGLLSPQGLNLPLEVVVGSAGGLFAILVIIHVLLLSVIFVKKAQYGLLKNQWQALEATKAEVDEVVTKLRTLQSSQKAIAGIAGQADLLWFRKINLISAHLPRTVWLNRLTLTEDMLFIEGSAVIKANTQGSDIYTFISNLKKDKDFSGHFQDLKLGPIQKRLVHKTEIEDFSIAAKLNSK